MTDVLDRSYQPGAQPAPRHTGVETHFDVALVGRVVLAVLSAAAGAMHLAMVPSHWGESAFEGIGFAITGWVQIVLAIALLTRPTQLLLKLTVLANVAFIAAWAVSRTWGLPFGDHSWHPHEAGFVDLAAVGIEVALIASALFLLRRPGYGRGWNRERLGAFAVVPIAIIALATAALGSPSARDHAGASHGAHGEAAGGGHGHASPEDELSGLAALENGHQHGGGIVEIDNETQAALSAQLAQTSRLTEKYPNIAAAEAAGYRRAGPFAPGLGTHYSSFGGRSEDMLISENGESMMPLLIFDGLEPDAPIAGFMYIVLGSEDKVPEGFIGPNDHWHYHTNTCIVTKDGVIEAPLGADAENVTKELCDQYGGSLIENTGYMVHVWTVPGYESDRGVFSNINPALACPDGTYHTIPLTELGFKTSACKNTEA